MAETKAKADEPKEPGKAARDAAKEAEPKEDAAAFPVERLIGESHAFLGQPSHVVAGALSSVSKKNLTVEEAKAAVKQWLKTPLKEG